MLKKINRNKLIVILFILIISSIDKLYSQGCANNSSDCDQGNGISTNPDNPINDNCSNMRNNFDWKVNRTDNLPEDYVVFGPNNVSKAIQNPFTGPSSSPHAGYVTNQSNSNYQPEDGWELLKVEFGIQGNVNINNSPNYQANQPSNYTKPKLPYMILYNKYSGTMRFFGSLLDANEDYETLEIILSIPSKDKKYQLNSNTTVDYDQGLKATNMLSIQGESIQPLDQETEETSISIFIKFRNNESEFFWFDLPVAYDPCLCNSRAQLDIKFQFTQTANISLNQVVDGGIKTENKQTSSGNKEYAKMVFSRLLAAGVSGATAIASSGAIVNVKAFVDLIDIVKEHPSRSQAEEDNLTVLKNYLTCTETMYSVLKGNYSGLTDTAAKKQLTAGINVLNGSTSFFTTLLSGCNNNDNAAIASTDALKFEGKFTRRPEIGGTEIFLALPGSNWGNTNLLPKDYVAFNTLTPSYVTYNERLGTFALLETPVLGKHEESFECTEYVVGGTLTRSTKVVNLKLNKGLSYTFNPKLNVNLENTIINARLVFTKYTPATGRFNSNCYIDNSNINSVTQTPINIYRMDNSNYRYSTPFVPIDYISNMPIRFDLYSYLGQVNTSDFDKYTFIQFQIIGESNNLGTDGKKVKFYQILTFPIKYENLVNDPNSSNGLKPQIVQGGRFFSNDIQFTNSQTMIYEGPVVISAKMSSTNGAVVKIYSLKGFELEVGAEVSPNVELIIGLPWSEVPQDPQSTAATSFFCTSSNKYKADNFSITAIEKEKVDADMQKSFSQNNGPNHSNPIIVKITPNPNTGRFNVSLFKNNEQNYSITLMDVTGKVLLNNQYEGEQNTQLIETNGLSPGVYFVKVSCGDSQKTEKIVIVPN